MTESVTNQKGTASTSSRTSAMKCDSSGEENDRISPNTSTYISRQQEKEQLVGLNDRLASYIERVRNLESENGRLTIQVRELEVTERKSKDDIVARYEAKVQELRTQVDAMGREKTKLEIEHNKTVSGHNEMKSKMDKQEKELIAVSADLKRNQERFRGLDERMNAAIIAKDQLEKENKTLKKDLDDAYASSNLLRQRLEEETVLRTELDGRIRALKDDLDFATRTHAHQLDEAKRSRLVEMSSFKTETESHYQNQFQKQLQAMRRDFDTRLVSKREEVDSMYKSRIEESYSAILQWEAKYRELQRSNAQLLHEYQNLLDLKVQLDTELLAYQKLLEGEETRLQLNRTPPEQTAGSDSQRAGTKRKRMETESFYAKSIRTSFGAESSVVIADVDSEGRFVQLQNTGTADVSIGAWIIKFTASDREVSFKFNSRQVINAGGTTSIWSNNSGQTANPPQIIVMKNQAWQGGDAVRVELLDAKNVLMAWRECIADYGSFRGDSPSKSC